MSIGNFIPQIWADRLEPLFQKSLVFGNLVNRNYEGQISGAGDTVKINFPGRVDVRDYTTSDLTYDALDAPQTTLTIDKKKYYAFYVEDIDRVQSKPDFLDEYMQEAAYGIKDSVDSAIAANWSDAGSITASTAINSANVLASLLALSQALDEKNVPTNDRWVVIPSWFKTKLVLAKVLVENTTNTAFNDGFVGRVAGFDVWQSNNVPLVSSNYKIMAGTNRAITFAGQFTEGPEVLRMTQRFGNYIRGLYVFGTRVIQPDALAVLDATIAPES